MQVGDIVNKYEIELDFNKQKAIKTTNKFEILGISKYKVVFNDEWFTTIYPEKEKYGKYDTETYFGRSKLWVLKLYDYDKMYIHLYTYDDNEEVIYKKLKKELQKRLEKEYSKYGLGIKILDEIL